jgi:hypothetical protein
MTYMERDVWLEHLAKPHRDEPILRPDLSYLEIVLEEHIARISRT